MYTVSGSKYYLFDNLYDVSICCCCCFSVEHCLLGVVVQRSC